MGIGVTGDCLVCEYCVHHAATHTCMACVLCVDRWWLAALFCQMSTQCLLSSQRPTVLLGAAHARMLLRVTYVNTGLGLVGWRLVAADSNNPSHATWGGCRPLLWGGGWGALSALPQQPCICVPFDRQSPKDWCFTGTFLAALLPPGAGPTQDDARHVACVWCGCVVCG